MKKSAYGKPIFINESAQIMALQKLEVLDELTIQKLIFTHPECLPFSDIDESFNPIIPVCMELNTTGENGQTMVSPNGELTIVETKLWRNPDARRVVIAQILDYAKELSNWTYSDLQREINRRLNEKGNTLFQLAQSAHPELVPSESDFVDSVSRNLEHGKFLLLLAGDGIREGAKGIVEFLDNVGHLNFAFAMVELNVYKGDGLGTLVIPKTIVKTIEIPKLKVEIPTGFTLSKIENYEEEQPTARTEEQEKRRKFYFKFWPELIKELSFDDPGQPLPSTPTSTNIYVYPGQIKRSWISGYFSKSLGRVGVYFRVQDDEEGNAISDFLKEYKDLIIEGFDDSIEIEWEPRIEISRRLPLEDIFANENREAIKGFFKFHLNEFVNVLRPLLKKMEE